MLGTALGTALAALFGLTVIVSVLARAGQEFDAPSRNYNEPRI